MTSVNVPKRMRELGDGVIHSFNATAAGKQRSMLEIPVEWLFEASPDATLVTDARERITLVNHQLEGHREIVHGSGATFRIVFPVEDAN